MKSWQEQCADIIDLLEECFPEIKYRIIFYREYINKLKTNNWKFVVESVRNDKGNYQGETKIFYLEVAGENIETLPELLLDKARLKVIEWQKEGLEKVNRQMEELEKAKKEVEKRLEINKYLYNPQFLTV